MGHVFLCHHHSNEFIIHYSVGISYLEHRPTGLAHPLNERPSSSGAGGCNWLRAFVFNNACRRYFLLRRAVYGSVCGLGYGDFQARSEYVVVLTSHYRSRPSSPSHSTWSSSISRLPGLETTPQVWTHGLAWPKTITLVLRSIPWVPCKCASPR